VVNEYFDFHNIDRLDVHWDATKNEHEPWVIRVQFELEGNKTEAIWTWDPKASIISENNEVARTITKYYEDAAFDDEPVFLGVEKKSKTVPQTSEKYHTVSFTHGLRLKELRDSLDADFQTQTAKQIIDTSYQNINPEYSSSQETTTQNQDQEAEQIEVNQTRPVLSILKASKEKGGAQQETDNDEDSTVPDFESFITQLDEEKADKEQDTEPIGHINITGRMRKQLAKRRSTRTKVPSWDDVMIPKSDEPQDGDLPSAA
jgi:hypothetical protein